MGLRLGAIELDPGEERLYIIVQEAVKHCPHALKAEDNRESVKMNKGAIRVNRMMIMGLYSTVGLVIVGVGIYILTNLL